MNFHNNHQKKNSGFTIIEMVVVIVVSSIMAVGVVQFIGDSAIGFARSASRNQLASSGRVVLDRMGIELQNALPRSFRVDTDTPVGTGDQCLEFIPISDSTSYLNPPFSGPGSTTFEAVDFNPFLTVSSPANSFAAISPDKIAKLYDGSNPGPLSEIDTITDPAGGDGKITITLTAAYKFLKRSPRRRIFVVEQPVSFCLVGEKIYRYSNYGFVASQCTNTTCLPSTAPDRVLITDSVDNTGLIAFNIQDATRRRNAIISFDMNFTSPPELVRLNHEVFIPNVP